MSDARTENIDKVCNCRMPVFGDLNERATSLEAVGGGSEGNEIW